MIELSTRKWAVIKRTAQILQPNVAKKQKLENQIAKLQEELEVIKEQILQWDGAIISMTGYSTEELIKRVVEPTDKTSADGKTLTITKWIPSSRVRFNEENNTYEIIDCETTACDGSICYESPAVEEVTENTFNEE